MPAEPEIEQIEDGTVPFYRSRRTKRLARLSLTACFAAVAGIAALPAAAIITPTLLPLAGAFAAAATIAAVVTTLKFGHSDEKDHYRRPRNTIASTYDEYYMNGKMTQRLGKLTRAGTIGSLGLAFATVAIAIAATPLLPIIGAAAAASTISTGGTSLMYYMRRVFQ